MAAYDYTDANLAAVRNAKIAYATGKRKVRMTIGDKSFEFAVSSKKELDEMEMEIVNRLQAATRSRFFLASTSKGL